MEVVNDEYWLAYAKNLIQNSVNSRNEAASKLQTFILWLWTIYIGAFTFGVTINALDAPLGVLMLLAAPIILLIVTYWLCVWTQLPVTSKFDPRIPKEIIKGYNIGLKEKNFRFNCTLASALISAIVLGTALTLFSFFNSKETKTSNNISAFYDDADKALLVISGTLPHNAKVRITIDTLLSDSSRVTIFSKSYLTQNSGQINENIKFNKVVKSDARVTATWLEDKNEKGLVVNVPKVKP